MRFFLDTEFIESGPHLPIELISIGMVASDGRTLYAESAEAHLGMANSFVKEHVIPKLTGPRHTLLEIRRMIWDFVDPDKYGRPEFWGYFADYDWVVFCHIFGTMAQLPPGWPQYCHDIKQWCDYLGNPQLPSQRSGEHNALADAQWTKECYAYLETIDRAMGAARRNNQPSPSVPPFAL